MSKIQVLNEKTINDAIDIVGIQLANNFKSCERIRDEYEQGSYEWGQIDKRLDVIGTSLVWLKETYELRDVTIKSRQLDSLLEFLENMRNKELQELELSLQFLKNLSTECMGRA